MNKNTFVIIFGILWLLVAACRNLEREQLSFPDEVKTYRGFILKGNVRYGARFKNKLRGVMVYF
jgi:hypothetical protein